MARSCKADGVGGLGAGSSNLQSTGFQKRLLCYVEQLSPQASPVDFEEWQLRQDDSQPKAPLSAGKLQEGDP